MGNRYFAILGVVSIFAAESVSAYEVQTHGVITHEAFIHSDILLANVLADHLGIDPVADVPFGQEYMDISGAAVRKRSADAGKYMTEIFSDDLNINVTERFNVAGWLMRGAIREDDIVPKQFPCEVATDNPQDDPYPDVPDRPVNHFYDPVNDKPLIIVTPQGETAANWSLGSTDAFAASPPDNATRRNHFTIRDAREAMFRALTGQTVAGDKSIGPGSGTVDNTEPADAVEAEAVRKAYWATTFRALGDVVHLIEDMAQPQHTRNDQHAGVCLGAVQTVLLGHESVYEDRVNRRALGEMEANSQTGQLQPLDKLTYTGYPIPQFNRYTDYFSTAPSTGDVMTGKGLADYSNRGFFTVRSKLGIFNTYANPPNNTNDPFYTESLIKPVPTGQAQTRYLEGKVPDTLDNTTTQVLLVKESMFRDEMIDVDTTVADDYGFTLDMRIYDAMADELVPRAVAYSAGFLNYFFRGRLEITPPTAGIYALLDHAAVNQIDQGFTTVKLKLRNLTTDIDDGQAVYPQEMTNGQLFAVAKFRRNPCYQPDLSGEVDTTGNTINGCSILPNPTDVEEIVVSQPLAAVAISRTVADEFVFDFSQAPIPINATDLYLQVVYRGVLGSEQDAVVVATLDIHEPTFVTVANATDFNVENGIYRLVDDPSQQSFPITDLLLRFNNSVSNAARLSSLAVGDFVRLAILTDKDPFTWLIMGFTPSTQVLNNVESWSARVAQHDAAGAFAANPANPLQQPFRGTHWFNLFHFVGNGGDGTDSTDFSPMSSAPFATAPVPIGWDGFNNTQ